MTVYLVGAGPGDPGLLTVRGRELLVSCDALVHDRLADPRIAALAPAAAERHDAGKAPGRHAMTQGELNDLLVELGRRRRRVVRLKGGDPFVYGRGGEEALALRAAGIDYEVVPGVTSAFAVPAYAGIPVTHRAVAAEVTVVTGHESGEAGDDLVDWDALAKRRGTLVMLMGMAGLERHARRLVGAGMDGATPAAVVASGTRPDQRTVTAPLAEIAGAVAEAGLRPPAVVVIGPVAALREQIAWYERRPLLGRRVVVTRARAQASALAARLEALGAAVVEAPAIRIEPLAFTPPDLAAYDVVAVTSANGVDRLLPDDVRGLAGVTVAAVGPATADALRAHGLVPDVVPERAVAEALLDALGDVGGRRVLVAAAEGARDVLPEGLRARGAAVDVLPLYRTVSEPVDPAAVRGADAVTFTSSSTVTNLLAALDGDADALAGARAVSIGPVTSQTLRDAGIEPAAEADPHDVDGLVDALVRALATGG